MKLSMKLNVLRENKKYTQKYVAEATGISCCRISLYEAGKSMPKYNASYQALADFFEVPIDFLKKDKPEDTKWLEAFLKRPQKETVANRTEADNIIAMINGKRVRGGLSTADILHIISEISK